MTQEGLIECPECQRRVAPSSVRCPGCGFQFRMSEVQFRTKQFVDKLRGIKQGIDARRSEHDRRRNEAATQRRDEAVTQRSQAIRALDDVGQSAEEQMTRYRQGWKHNNQCSRCLRKVAVDAFVCRHCGVRLPFDQMPT